MKFNFLKKNNEGLILTTTLVLAFISVLIVTGITSWFVVVLKSNRNLVAREQAFHVAEAGIEYYRWHLAADNTDFTDGTEEDGPYVHVVEDKLGNPAGEFSLEITAPGSGSTLTEIESTGFVYSHPDVSRTIRVQLAIPSFGDFAAVSNSDIRFGEGTTVYGPIHSNGGVRFDGLAHNIVSSAKETYDDPDHSGSFEFGVHTHVDPVDPAPPGVVPDRPDVFIAGREFPVNGVSFSGISADMVKFKELGQSEDGYYFNDSNAYGYKIVLKTNGTFDIYKVIDLYSPYESGCYEYSGGSQDGWGTWSIQDEEFIENYPLPENGIIFIEDDVWVEGQISEARITVVAATFPDISSTRKSITINNDLLYSRYNGEDSIGLIAQKNINIGLISEDDLQIDAALISQNNRIGRYYYYYKWYAGNSLCRNHYIKNSITVNGMIGSKDRYGFAYTNGTGYADRIINYDANLLYNPPPHFPLTSDIYEIVTWEELD
jgi:hypothetical protein